MMTKEKSGSSEDLNTIDEQSAAKARALTEASEETRNILMVMLAAWRLYYIAHEMLNPLLAEVAENDEQGEGIRNILIGSMRERALQPYMVEELSSSLTDMCVPFLESHTVAGEDGDGLRD
jgi:hypothetical protein